MIKKKVKEVKSLVTEEVLCNKCGTSLVAKRYFVDNPIRLDHGEEGLVISGLSEIVVHGGFESNYLEDGKSYHFSLCEKCIFDLMNSFLIPPDTEEESF